MRHSSREIGIRQDPPEIPEVWPWCGHHGERLQTSNVTSSAGEGVDNGIHRLAVGVQSLSVGDQMGIFTNFVQPAKHSDQESKKAIAETF